MDLSALLSQNEFAAGGLVLMLIGAVLAALRNVPLKLFNWCRDRFLLTVEFDSNDSACAWVQSWLTEAGRRRRATWAGSIRFIASSQSCARGS